MNSRNPEESDLARLESVLRSAALEPDFPAPIGLVSRALSGLTAFTPQSGLWHRNRNDRRKRSHRSRHDSEPDGQRLRSAPPHGAHSLLRHTRRPICAFRVRQPKTKSRNTTRSR